MQSAGRTLRVALYARVSTNEQTCENQILEIHQFCAARGWGAGRDYRDEGISGVSARPALRKLMAEARRRRFDVVVVWRLDRLGRNLRIYSCTSRSLALLESGLSASARASISPRLPEGCSATSWLHWQSSSESVFGRESWLVWLAPGSTGNGWAGPGSARCQIVPPGICLSTRQPCCGVSRSRPPLGD